MSASGIYMVKLYWKGKKVPFNIDDTIAVMSSGTPLLTRPSKNGAWWLPLLEKAYAKMNVNYL
jgi:hypothetical protein